MEAADRANNSLRHYEYSFMFPFEDKFDTVRHFAWFRDNVSLSFFLVAFYLISIYLLKLYVKDKPRLELKSFAFFWNVSLAIFSFMVVIRIWPDLFYDWMQYGFEYTLCDSTFMIRNRVFAFWLTLFTYSKFFEFGDTILLVLRKRPLTFLHVYHHTTIALGTFYFVRRELAAVRWVPLINGWIHTVMYTYFALKVVNIKIPKLFSILLTTMQICQMLYFVYVILIVNYYNLVQGKQCHLPIEDSITICPVIASYAVLFMNFFYHSYLKTTPSRPVIKKKE